MNRPARIAVGVACSAAVVGLTWWGLTIMSDPPPVENKSAALVNERPTPAPVRTVLTEPTPTPTTAPEPAPLDRGNYEVATPIDVAANVAPPLPPVVVDAPPVSVNEDAPEWAQGMVPCAQEDSDNCYWDALTMGNGGGFSFVTVDGVTTYPQVLPDISTLRICEVEDDDACYFPGIERGELANWVNAPGLAWTYFSDGVTEDLNGWDVR